MSTEQNLPKALESLLLDLREYAVDASQSNSEESVIDCRAVLQCALGMMGKMHEASEKGRSGWHDPQRCSLESLTHMFFRRIQKGDMIDVMNFAMMIWSRASQLGGKEEVAAYMTEQLKGWAKVDLLSELYDNMHDAYEAETTALREQFLGQLGLKENPTFAQLDKAERVIGDHMSKMFNQVAKALSPAKVEIQVHQMVQNDQTVKMLVSFVRTNDVKVPLDVVG